VFWVESSHRYHKISANPILDAWRSGSACDSSNRDIHKVIRSNRVAFIDLTIHDCSHPFARHNFSPGWLLFFGRANVYEEIAKFAAIADQGNTSDFWTLTPNNRK
jgi:hypothetical protein